LIIHGDSLIHTSENAGLAVKLLRICQQCEVVLCCRVSPKQKQEIVSMVRNNVHISFHFHHFFVNGYILKFYIFFYKRIQIYVL